MRIYFEINDDDLRSELREFETYLREIKKFLPIGEGSCRRVWMQPDRRYVIKIPHTQKGLRSNVKEHCIWHKHKSYSDEYGIHYAPCRLLKNQCLMMYAVKQIWGVSDGCHDAVDNGNLDYLGESESAPEWIRYLDCAQAGKLDNGRVVAYDYGVF